MALALSNMNRKLLATLILTPILIVAMLWGIASIWFQNRNRNITEQWSNRRFTPTKETLESDDWIKVKLPTLIPQSLGTTLLNIIKAYSSETLEGIQAMQSPEGLNGVLSLDRGLLAVSEISTGHSISDSTRRNEDDLPKVWAQFWRDWPKESVERFVSQKAVRLRGIDTNSLRIVVVTNIQATSPMEILLTPEYPSFVKFQSSFRPKPVPDYRDRLQCVDVALFVKSETRAYPVAFRLVYSISKQRWYLTDVTTTYMYGMKQSDVYLL